MSGPLGSKNCRHYFGHGLHTNSISTTAILHIIMSLLLTSSWYIIHIVSLHTVLKDLRDLKIVFMQTITREERRVEVWLVVAKQVFTLIKTFHAARKGVTPFPCCSRPWHEKPTSPELSFLADTHFNQKWHISNRNFPCTLHTAHCTVQPRTRFQRV